MLCNDGTNTINSENVVCVHYGTGQTTTLKTEAAPSTVTAVDTHTDTNPCNTTQ